MLQVADFIEEISTSPDPPSPILFYANLFGTTLRDSTGPGGFRDNMGDTVSNQVRRRHRIAPHALVQYTRRGRL